MISDTDRRILISQDDWTLAQWHRMLNIFEWPALLPNPEPPYYIAGPCRRWNLMNWIWLMVGEKLISRVWNHKLTDQEFDDFWKATYEKDPEARIRYEKRLHERAKEAMKPPPTNKTEGPPA